jgi:dissimilatory sulfite reductase (desulfoviridin) alpha/beta subunit
MAPTPSGMFLSDDGAIEFVVKDNLTVTGATFQFVVPQTLSTVAIPAAGAPGTLTINPGIPMAQVTSCKGPSKCTAVLDTDYAAKVTLLP